MIAISENFKNAMKQSIKEIQAYIDYDENTIRDSDDLLNFKVSCDSGLCKTAMRKLEAKYLGNHNLLGKWVKVGFGVRLPDGEFEYLNYGSFLVTEQTVTKDTETTDIVAYDKMVSAMTQYDAKLLADIEYPLRLIDYTRVLCEVCGLELGNELFGKNLFKQSFHPTITKNGLTYKYLPEEDCILIDGTKSVTDGYYLELPFPISCSVDENYTLSSYYVSGSVTIPSGYAVAYWGSLNNSTGYLDNWWDVALREYDSKTTGKMTKNKITHFWFYVSQGVKFENYKVKLQFEKGDIQTSTYKAYNPMNDWQVTQELWENIEGITYRDIFVQIAQATGSTCVIHDDKVYFKSLTDTGESLTYDNLFKLKLEAQYGEINSVVLSRTPSEDNIYKSNEASITTNGLTEFKIENNEIIDKDRDNAITPIFDTLNGIAYYPFEATTEGLGWYEVADNLTIINDLGEEFKTSLFNYSITIDGSVKETLKTTAENKTQTQYQYATTIAKRVKNTEVIVNKQDQYIKQIVSDIEGVNEKYTSIFQDIENIIANVQNSGGSNLIKNSVMFAYEGDANNVEKVANWSLEGSGVLKVSSDTTAMQKGGISGHSFTLLEKQVRQNIPVVVNTDDTKVYYSFSIKIKKDVAGQCYVRLFNTTEDYMVVHLAEGVGADYEEFEITGLLPKENYYTLSLYATEDSNATFTDCMFVVGEYKCQWTQADGEVMNTQVNINLDGITVKSSVYVGDYTIISPLEFAGYSNINGTPTKVFCLNKDVTEVTKLLAKDEIKMPPLKVVPITEGEYQGWAFVPST